MLEIFIKGFIIGALVSAPVGPIGMLTVQRTLNRGRWHGFFTGLGVMTADMIYGFISLVGIGVFSSVLDHEERLVQTVGSVFLVVLGFVIFRKNPLKDWNPYAEQAQTRYLKDYISAFLLGITNIGIMLVYITLFAHFRFNPIADGSGDIGVAMLSLLSGAFLWWFFITGLISRLRRYFNRRGLIIFNRLIGSILMGIGTLGIVLFFLHKMY